ncbi:glycoside hydrolase family 18 protein [Cellvibrio sp. NN19]|uniref:glycoside hydrolase family 18 protein n=1 Tax=Cellvibrio chitinivorans TaxID=3102792 RepID=UPI002B41215C|nr:glycoside hydrolase family 18 protein [Cellvibrio sp. NN19]WQA41851.1 chitinase Chi18A [Cellvibrio sp. NN19]
MKSFLSAISAGLFALALGACTSQHTAKTQTESATTAPKIIAYYMGDGSDLQRYNFNQLTHIIYSFLHLQGNQLSFDSATDKQAMQRLVALKKDYPHLKVMLSLGGWGGCETCSDVFNNADNRKAFAQSTLAIIKEYNADGIDLDWEYPTIAGFPGHKFATYDRANFTALVQELRAAFGDKYELSFAAGGFDSYLETAVDWKAIMPLLDNVNLMSYDIVNGATPHTGHHTALFSTPQQKDSTDNAVQYLINNGVPAEKIVIGAAFYARVWEQVAATNNGLYQPGIHVEGADYKEFATRFKPADGYVYYWDDIAKAPSFYSISKKTFATFDDERSLAEKARYVQQYKLGGMMFWQLPHDTDNNGLLDTIYKNLTHKNLTNIVK